LRYEVIRDGAATNYRQNRTSLTHKNKATSPWPEQYTAGFGEFSYKLAMVTAGRLVVTDLVIVINDALISTVIVSAASIISVLFKNSAP
jgi:hypothetical protein